MIIQDRRADKPLLGVSETAIPISREGNALILFSRDSNPTPKCSLMLHLKWTFWENKQLINGNNIQTKLHIETKQGPPLPLSALPPLPVHLPHWLGRRRDGLRPRRLRLRVHDRETLPRRPPPPSLPVCPLVQLSWGLPSDRKGSPTSLYIDTRTSTVNLWNFTISLTKVWRFLWDKMLFVVYVLEEKHSTLTMLQHQMHTNYYNGAGGETRAEGAREEARSLQVSWLNWQISQNSTARYLRYQGNQLSDISEFNCHISQNSTVTYLKILLLDIS